MKTFYRIIAAALLALTACCPQRNDGARHAEWTYDAVVYEMNVRQFTPEGTFAAAETHLPRLRDMGVDIVWLMPIHPIGELERKGTLGSYYAIRDYYDINPEFGDMSDFERFLASAHESGLKVILDYVANHTSPDAAWVTDKPASWYVRDENGCPAVQYDWTDIAKLNYDIPEVRSQMRDVLLFWTAKGVDGFRCDAAKEMPDEFWTKSFAELRRRNPDLYLLAEGEGVNFHDDGFDATYAWELHHLLNDIAQGKKSAADLKEYLAAQSETYPRSAFRLMFTSNHDENSWAGTEFERMGDAAAAMAALTYVLPQGQPLIYTGQEIGYDHRFEFFEKDAVECWQPNGWTEFYSRLNTLRHDNAALAAGERGGEAVYMDGAAADVLAFTRRTEGNKVLCMFNLSSEPTQVTPAADAAGTYVDAMTGVETEIASGEEVSLGAWEYRILTLNRQ